MVSLVKEYITYKYMIYIYELKNNLSPHEIEFDSDDTLVNDEVIDKYKQYKRYLPYDKKIKKYYDIFYIPEKVLYYRLKCVELITKAFLADNPLIKTIIDRHIKHSNYLLNDKGHDFLQNQFGLHKRVFYHLEENQVVSKIIKTRLYDYQRDNLFWMRNLERTPIEFRMTDHKFIVLEDGRFYDYYLDEFVEPDMYPLVKFRGGILMDDVGIGKTIQALSLCASDSSKKTLIVVPNHLLTHWNEQIDMHCDKFIRKIIYLITFDDFIKYHQQYTNVNRIIVDEIHETFCNTVMINALCHFDVEHKWGLTATPWVHHYSLYYLVRFLTNHTFLYKEAVRIQYYHEVYEQIFRKNLKSDIEKEVYLPPMNVFNVLIEFSEVERNTYDSEKSANEYTDTNYLREMCGCIEMNNDYNSETTMMHFQNAYTIELNKENTFVHTIQNIVLQMQELDSRQDMDNRRGMEELEINRSYYNSLLERQRVITKNRYNAWKRYESGLKRLQNIVNMSQSKEECSICYQNMQYQIAYYKCGHYFCSECINRTRRDDIRCPYCRTETSEHELYIIRKNCVQKYNSKINRLLELVVSKRERFLVFTQFEKVLRVLKRVFDSENIKSQIYDQYSIIDKDTQIIFMSMIHNASGIDMTSFHNIVIYEPFQDICSWRQIEHQIIGRIYRIGQKNVTNVYRLIINNTIESDIYYSRAENAE